jgi:hypothetical protein
MPGTVNDALRFELLTRLQRLLKQQPDYPSIPDNRFNKRINLYTEGVEIVIRSKRRGDVDVTVIDHDDGSSMFVFRNSADHQNIFNAEWISSFVLPVLRRQMVLEDLSDVC